MSEARGIKALLKRVVHRAMRPGLWPLMQQLAHIETRLDNQATRLQAINRRTEPWTRSLDGLQERLDHIESTLEQLTHTNLARDKHHDELAYWRWLIKTDEGRASLYAPFETAFGRWQRDRLRELACALGLDEPADDQGRNGALNGETHPIDPALDAWCAAQSVVELGAGPYPAIAAAPAWRRAVAVDPLAKSYVEEGLLAGAAAHVVYIESSAERVPLPPGFADLVVMDNALDHVSDPRAVLDEVLRLLRPGGLFWVLVDLSTHRDHMHPNPFDEVRIRSLVREKGFEVVSDRVSGHKSHPSAYGEYRALLRRPDTRSDLEVVISEAIRGGAVRRGLHA